MLTSYKEYINVLADTASEEEFYNSDAEHAKIVLSALFRTAQEKVCVFCKDMLSEVNSDPEYINEVQSFLDRGGKLDILLHGYNVEIEKKSIWSVLSSYFSTEQVRIKYNNNKGFKNNEGMPVHFTVADSLAYRFEFDTLKKEARGFFNKPQNAQVLSNNFDKAFSEKANITLE